MSEKAIAGVLGAVGLLVVLAAGLFTAWSFFATEDPVLFTPTPDDGTEASEVPVEADPERPVGPGPAGAVYDPHVDGPIDDEGGMLDITYAKLKAALDRRNFMELKRLVATARGQVDPQLVADLIAFLADTKYGFNAGAVLGMIKTPGTVDALFRFLLETESALGRRTAVNAMALSGGIEAVPQLLQLMHQGADSQMVVVTASALGMIGNRDAVEGLLEVLKSRRWPDLESNLQSALGQVRHDEGVALIGQALADASDDGLKRSLIQALGQGGSPAAVGPLRRFVEGTESVALRAQSVSALGAVGTSDAILVVLDLAKESGPLQNVARHALRNARDKTLLPDLVKSLDETQDPGLQRSLLVAIGSLGDRTATPRLVQTLESSTSVDTQIAAVQALGAMKDPVASEALGKTLRGDGHLNLRVQAARALERIGDPKNIVVLKSVLEQDIPENLKAVVNFSIRRLEMKIPPKPRER